MKKNTKLKAPKGYLIVVRVIMRPGQQLFYFVDSYSEGQTLLSQILQGKKRPTIIQFSRKNRGEAILDCSEIIEASIIFKKDDDLRWIVD